MASKRMPKEPKMGASQLSWDRFEGKMKKYVAGKNETTRRRGLKNNILAKIRI